MCRRNAPDFGYATVFSKLSLALWHALKVHHRQQVISQEISLQDTYSSDSPLVANIRCTNSLVVLRYHVRTEHEERNAQEFELRPARQSCGLGAVSPMRNCQILKDGHPTCALLHEQ